MAVLLIAFGCLAANSCFFPDSIRQAHRTFMSLRLVVLFEILLSVVAPVVMMVYFSSSCQKHYLDVSPKAKEEMEAGNIFYSDIW